MKHWGLLFKTGGAAPEAARNLTDEMIRTLADRGGIMGLNYCVSFVRRDWKPGQSGESSLIFSLIGIF